MPQVDIRIDLQHCDYLMVLGLAERAVLVRRSQGSFWDIASGLEQACAQELPAQGKRRERLIAAIICNPPQRGVAAD